jgi:cupin fold WbuC family metalloprotein
MIKIDHKLIEDVVDTSRRNQRKRKNYNFHKVAGDLLQRMLNVMQPGTYVQPHKHENPDKREVFIILKGKAAAYEFDDSGEVTGICILDPEKQSYGVEFPAGVWHTIVCLQNDTVLYEVKDGPYLPSDDKNFAVWAPEENTQEAFEYLKKLLDAIEN